MGRKEDSGLELNLHRITKVDLSFDTRVSKTTIMSRIASLIDAADSKGIINEGTNGYRSKIQIRSILYRDSSGEYSREIDFEEFQGMGRLFSIPYEE